MFQEFCQNFFKSEKFWVQKIGWVKKISGQKKTLGPKKYQVQKILGLKNLGQKEFWSKNIKAPENWVKIGSGTSELFMI